MDEAAGWFITLELKSTTGVTLFVIWSPLCSISSKHLHDPIAAVFESTKLAASVSCGRDWISPFLDTGRYIIDIKD